MRNIIFDLDGTLVHSLPGIEESARMAITRVMPDVTMPDLRPLIGPPIAVMFAKLWPELEAGRMVSLLAEFRAHYDETGCLLSESYPRVLEILGRLRGAGVRLFVLTNKPIRPARKILSYLGFLDFFAEVVALNSTQPPFVSKTEGARFLKENFNLSPGS
ncbi:MAG: HAD hydrolase-like protein, partial [Chthoniobacteraceae bacterium]